VSKGDVVRLLDAIMDRGAPIQANRTLALVRKVFNFAVAEGYLERSPAHGIPARAVERVRTRVLESREISELWLALGGAGFDDVTADALRLQLLLGARVREITGMHRNELDLVSDPPIWVLPNERSKGNRAVARPLSAAALEVVCRRLADSESEYVFASPIDPRRPITPRAVSRAVQRAALRALIPSGFTPHDLRRTCRTGLAALGVSEIVAKKILGHAPPRSDVTASVYDQYGYIPEMRLALASWERKVLREICAGYLPKGVAA
jgi:integrase